MPTHTTPASHRGLPLIAAATVWLALFSSPTPSATAPTLKLFPTTVLEDIRHTGRVAKEMESGLQQVIERLDLQQQMTIESKCDGAEEDPGCNQLRQQLSTSYLEMLQIMEQNLPEMESAVETTRKSLAKRLRTELGQRMTPWELQQALLGESQQIADSTRPSLRGRSGMRLSDRFNQYYKLVANGSASNDTSLAVIASDIYLDMEETANLITRTRQEISRATLMGQLSQSFGVITPEMQQIVNGVKQILFGDPAAEQPIAAPPATQAADYHSPLAM
ncbi:hypothetical protein [Candidatus Endoriftia persephonae]|jgi:hypothetical protein|uniref:Secreted protein n=2 Tax=Gammaproteobacteria TaxID=1236 RepID=G2FCA7_9GAMM|nr:hypothetical protein [Candidatus Endoriftia persephone]EGW55470.1 hypothetical protein TevJSym_ac00330 [endosymbiont of Tevnia jerichonana (vent Tica)]USF86626.1 hypothetical protein L0Y14_10805 [Candidatus Endoriftia persephone]